MQQPDGRWPGETKARFRIRNAFFRDFFGGTGQYAGKSADGEKRTMGTRILATGAGLLRTSALALVLGTGAALAQQTDITIGMVLEPPNLDPTAGAAAAIDEVVYANIFEGLTRFAPDGSVIPGLAESWDISEDGLTYTFNLREGVTFHDGSAMTAEDVVFSLDRARAEDSTNAQKPLFAGIESVEAVDDTTVVVTLTAPDGAFPFKMAWGDAVIVDPASAETNATNPVGTGPFRFSEWVQGDRVEIVRNDDYWGEPVALEAATFQFISDPNAAFAAMMSGDIDAFPNFPAPETLAQFEANPQFTVVVGSTEGETILAMNNAGEPLNDVRIRQAITPRDQPAGHHRRGHVRLRHAHRHPFRAAQSRLRGSDRQLRLRPRRRPRASGRGRGRGADAAPDAAAALLRPPRRGDHRRPAARGGDRDRDHQHGMGRLAGTVFRGKDFDLTIVSHTEPFDINIYANPDYYFQYDNPDFQALNAALEVESDPAERSALLAQMQTMISEDYVNGYLFQLAKTGVANANIEGLWENSPTQANDLTGVRWTQ
jgi:peptide/nickel transport system substrate-binding protein